ncbi:imph-1 [Pristionchus pacificus]|uniref:Zbp-1 n=1 Tax=Pristionchus pacificus TaxID=54126 RepID=A0A2A6BAX8_PRIPA|nr:imph-1 [Pristionchus pacificus]|eukprot:PDM63016.1 zbp-1 [Pristionchus pacificus]
MDYYRPTQAVSHSGPTPQNYMYQPTGNQSNSGMYYQTMSGYPQQASPYAMQPTVSQGNTMVNQSGASGATGNGRRTRDNNGPGVMTPGIPRNQNEVPLRMTVDAKYVGAIIGQQGNKIKEITRESKAKCIVDAQKGMRDPQGSSEKIILIDGTAENSSKAVVKILEVIEAEKEKERDRELAGGDSGLGDLEKSSSNEVELKLRAQNQLVGRLIGKQGATIKKIMSETETVIYVSNLPEGAASASNIAPMYAHDMGGMLAMITDRTITVKGQSISAVSTAEAKISAKLRQSFEYDVSSRMAYGPGMPMMPMPYADPMAVMAGMRPPMTSSFKTTKMYVPNNMVGAIIGSKGSHIRGINRSTGAQVRVEGNEKREEKKEEGVEGTESPVERESSPPVKTSPESEKKKDEDEGEEIEKREEERLVTIMGTDNQIYKAQYAIFAKIAEQQQLYLEEVKLRSEVNVPSRLVGRIIGKGGQNVRELQRLTGAHVKIAEENNPENREKKDEKEEDGETTSDGGLNGETTVRIVGNMNATINVEARIASLVGDFHRTSLNESRANGSYSAAPATSAVSNTAE